MSDRQSKRGALLFALLLGLPLLASLSSARAATITNERPFLFSFDGSGTTAGRFGSSSHAGLAVDEESGDVYVLDRGHEAIDRFDAEGHATEFTAGPAAGHSSLYGPGSPEPALFKEQNSHFFYFTPDLAVDNSGLYGGAGATEHGEQGRLYVSGDSGGPIDAFAPSGEFLWALSGASVEGACGIAVDPEGHLWVGAGSTHKVLEFKNTGSPPSLEHEFTVTSGNEQACFLGVDRAHSVYAALSPYSETSTLDKYTESAPGEWSFASTIDPNKPLAVAVDQSSAAGHVFAAGLDPEHQQVAVNATEGSFRLCFDGECTVELPYDVPASGCGFSWATPAKPTDSLQCALAALPSIDGSVWNAGRSVRVRGGPGGSAPYILEFALRFGNAPQLSCEDGSPPLTGGSGCSVETINDGAPGGFQEYEPGGALVGRFGRDLIGQGRGIAHSGYEPPGEAPLDRVYLYDAESQSVKAFGPLASGPAPDVSCQAVDGVEPRKATARCTIDPRGLPNAYHLETIQPTLEQQSVEMFIYSGKPGGSFRLSSGGTVPQWTEPMPFNVSPEAMQKELEALPAYGRGNVSVSGSPWTSTSTIEPHYTVTFVGDLVGHPVPVMGSDGSELASYLDGIKVVGGPAAQSWGAAESTPPQSIEPTDEAEHQLSITLSGLRQSTDYLVRLVGTDAESHLSSYSAPLHFKTLPPPPPSVSGLAVTALTTSSAHVSATVDPKEAATTWRLLLAAKPHGTTQADCEALPGSAFDVAKEGRIPYAEPGTVAVSEDLTGLPPAQTYCLRLSATNAGGGDRKDAEFTTLTVHPTGALIAFAAPRTDTSARINAYVDPEGETLTYRFEYSSDGGEHWTPLPEETNTSEARREIVVGTELSELLPDRTYRYRLAEARNPAGPAPGLPSPEGGFTTRTSAEVAAVDPASCPNEEVRANRHFSYLPQCRGIELVNSPEKGNQNLIATTGKEWEQPPLTAYGERALWSVAGGAPGANSGAGAVFLAKRTGPSEAAPNGWTSHSLIPPAVEQIHGEDGYYEIQAATPGLGSFLFLPGAGSLFAETLVRLDESQGQEELKTYGGTQLAGDSDITDDGARVLHIDRDLEKSHPAADQLEDIGTPGHPEVLSRLPSNSLPECGVEGEGIGFSGEGATGAGAQWRPGYHRMAVTDASRVYFQVHPNGSGCESASWEILERNRAAGPVVEGKPQGKTIEVAPPDPSNALIRATPDGRSLYFITAGNCREPRQVSPYDCRATETSDTNGHADVYRWQEAPGGVSGTDTCLTCAMENEAGEKITDANPRQYIGTVTPVMVSDDFSHLYFESTSKLTPQASAGEGNLYALTIASGKLRFVATPDSPGKGTLGKGDAELSEDGNVLVFETTPAGNHELTADRLAASCPRPAGGEAGTGPCTELYRYDDRDGSLECLSCRRGGITSASAGAREGAPFKLSADGSTVAFVTRQKLVESDINNGYDLYDWRAGERRLITDGVGDFGQPLTAALTPFALSASGRDILFRAVAPGLTGFELDRFANLYDARIDGGFEVPPATVHCSEESCQGPLQAAPPRSAPNSATYEGPGDVREGSSCAGPARRARALRRRARVLEARARRAHGARRARRLRAGARRLARRAGHLSKRAERCRRANRRRAK